jgi:hypothetical protein
LLGILPGTIHYLNDNESKPIKIHQNRTITFKNIYIPKNVYLHSSFSNNSFGFVCKINSDYHKLCKYFPMRDVEFDIWFTTNGKKIIYTPEMDLLLLEISFKE